MKIKEQLLHIDEQQSHMLEVPLFDVNMRLYMSNKRYKKIVTDAISHMCKVLNTKFSDYPELKGISGANVGIPFNLVVVKKDDGTHLVMINPKITKYGRHTKIVKSNCGSINLKEPIKVRRWKFIKAVYHDLGGAVVEDTFTDKDYAFTVQHEVDHNRGITILTEEIK